MLRPTESNSSQSLGRMLKLIRHLNTRNLLSERPQQKRKRLACEKQRSIFRNFDNNAYLLLFIKPCVTPMVSDSFANRQPWVNKIRCPTCMRSNAPPRQTDRYVSKGSSALQFNTAYLTQQTLLHSSILPKSIQLDLQSLKRNMLFKTNFSVS